MRTDHAKEVRSALCDPRRICESLGWLEGSKRQARGLMIRCPSHGEKNPSCSVTTGPDGTVRARCFGCDWSADALGMVAFAFGLSCSTDFREVLAIGAEVAGQIALAEEIRDGQKRVERPRIAPPEPQPEPEYPPVEEVRALWESAVQVNYAGSALRMLRGRGIDFSALAEEGLARVIRDAQLLPRWAAYGARSWVETGHTLILPSFDATGALRSVRAWRVIEGDTPKRLPPKGCKAAELVNANRLGVMMLKRLFCPLRLWIVEGEPDLLTSATTFARSDAVIGIGSGSWSEAFARRVPRGTEVVIATHPDEAGDRYAEHVIETLGEQCPTLRWRPAA